MTTRSLRFLLLLCAATVAAITAYWYWSPLLAMRSMKAAAEARDADTFNRYVDYPKLRESLKGQFHAKMASALGGRPQGSDMEKAGAALGAMLGLAVVDKIVDAIVRPEMIMTAMKDARLQDPASKPGSARQESKNVRWTFERKGTDRIVAYGTDGDAYARSGKSPAGFVFDREGFATWKLTEIRLPE